MALAEELKRLAHVLIDSYFVIDRQHNIVDYNQAFYAMLPRAVARSLKTKKCYEVLRLNICAGHCIAEQCWRGRCQVRLDEITGTVGEDGPPQRFILSAIPIYDPQGEMIGAMEVQRNVTDEMTVQAKYRRQLATGDARVVELQQKLAARTRQLAALSQKLARAQRDLLRAKTELFG